MKRGWRIKALVSTPQDYHFSELRKAVSLPLPSVSLPSSSSSSSSSSSMRRREGDEEGREYGFVAPLFTLFHDYVVRSQYLDVCFCFLSIIDKYYDFIDIIIF